MEEINDEITYIEDTIVSLYENGNISASFGAMNLSGKGMPVPEIYACVSFHMEILLCLILVAITAGFVCGLLCTKISAMKKCLRCYRVLECLRYIIPKRPSILRERDGYSLRNIERECNR